MQRWDHAQMSARWDDEEKYRDFFVRYFTSKGVTKEEPEPIREETKLLGKTNIRVHKPSDEQCWDWLFAKIAQLGQEGWELVTAPDSAIAVQGISATGTYKWMLWFRRPAS